MKKSREMRSHEIKDLLKKLNSLELSHNVKLCPIMFSEIKEFYKICQEYIRSGETCIGSIRIEPIGRDLVYELYSHKEPVVLLKAHKT